MIVHEGFRPNKSRYIYVWPETRVDTYTYPLFKHDKTCSKLVGSCKSNYK